jgi:hypothetical protein
MVAVVELIRRDESKIYEVHSDVVGYGGKIFVERTLRWELVHCCNFIVSNDQWTPKAKVIFGTKVLGKLRV